MGAVVACAILSVAKTNSQPLISRADYKPYVSNPIILQEEIEEKFDVRFSEDRILKSARILEKADVTVISRRSDGFPHISVDFQHFEKICKSRKIKNVDPHVRDLFSKFFTIKCFGDFGDEWLEEVIYQFKANPYDDDIDIETGTEESEKIPASDRIVTLSDNQRTEFENVSLELIDEVEKSNGIDGDPTFRQIVLGQLKAGREMIRAQIFNVELMYLVMVEALKSLIKKYEGHVIGATATTLMELLIKHVFGGD